MMHGVFNKTFINIIDKTTPVKEARHQSEPWMSVEMMEKFKIDRLLHKHRSIYLEFCIARNHVQNSIKVTKQDDINNKAQKDRNDLKNLTSYLRSLGYSKWWK